MRFVAFTIGLLTSLAWAAPLSPTAKAVIPPNVRQIINLDYRMLRIFGAAMTLKEQALPNNLRQFETALQNAGVNPDSDLDTLTFASFDDEKKVMHMVAVASGPFSSMNILTQLRLQKLRPIAYLSYDLYPVSKALVMTILHDDTLLLGDIAGIKSVLNIRDNRGPTIEINKDLNEVMRPIEKATVWSVLDREGTQRMLLLALGDDPKLAGIASLEQKVIGAYFRMNFRGGVRFDMDVVTSDSASSMALTSLLKMGILYKKITTNSAQKMALGDVSVASKRISKDSERSDLKMQFKAGDRELQTLLRSQCFTSMSNERKELAGFTSAIVTDDQKGMEGSARLE